jgi:hypothetical protein
MRSIPRTFGASRSMTSLAIVPLVICAFVVKIEEELSMHSRIFDCFRYSNECIRESSIAFATVTNALLSNV